MTDHPPTDVDSPSMAESAPIDDASLLSGFEDCSLPEKQWTHQAHIRTAYMYLRRHPFDEALEQMRNGIQRYNASRQVPEDPHRGYHETLTVAWLTVVAATMKHHGVGHDSLDFCRQQPHLLNRFLLRLFYTRRTIMSPEAKRTFVEPDITPLPGNWRESPTGEGGRRELD